MDYRYWQRYDPAHGPLFPEIEWTRPQQRAHAGKLLIAGGNKLGFSAAAAAYTESLDLGIGEAQVVLPDSLKRSVPAGIAGILYLPSNPSGGLSQKGNEAMLGAAAWADMMLLIGDTGRNSETAIIYENIVRYTSVPLVITRDAIDLLHSAGMTLAERPDTLFVASFAQVQKLFRSVYYPKILTFRMQLVMVVEALHKFTITYPSTVLTLHSGHLILAHNGQIITMEFGDPMAIWRGSVATRAAVHWCWNRAKPFEAIASSLTSGISSART